MTREASPDIPGAPRAGTRVLVTGGGGFIGGWLVADLLSRGYEVRAADVKPFGDWYQVHSGANNPFLELKEMPAPVDGMQQVFNLAADMGGMGFIEHNKAPVHALRAHQHAPADGGKEQGVERFFYSSSACVYAADKQARPTSPRSKEDDAYPAMPEDGYGWEKLFSERMCRHFDEDFGLDDPRRPLPQRLRAARHLGRRPREGAGRDLPQGRRPRC